jgi:hypothetical protein
MGYLIVHRSSLNYEEPMTPVLDINSVEIRRCSIIQGDDYSLQYYSLPEIIKWFPNASNLLVASVRTRNDVMNDIREYLIHRDCMIRNIWFDSKNVSFLNDNNIQELGLCTSKLTRLRIDSGELTDISHLDLSNVKCLILSHLYKLKTLEKNNLRKLAVLVINPKQLHLITKDDNIPRLQYIFIDDCPPYEYDNPDYHEIENSSFWRPLFAREHGAFPRIVRSNGIRGTNRNSSSLYDWQSSANDVIDSCSKWDREDHGDDENYGNNDNMYVYDIVAKSGRLILLLLFLYIISESWH